MATAKDLKWSVDKLSGENWSTWKFQMKHVLLARDLWKCIDGSYVLAEGANAQMQAEYHTKHQKALTTIVMSVSTPQLYLITASTTAKEAWTALSNHFECKTLGNKLIIKKQYFRSQMNENTSMEEHLKEMKGLAEKLAAIESPISEEDQVVTLLGSLPESYQNVVTALEARTDDLSLSYVQQTLLYEEKKRNGAAKMVGERDSALVANKGKGNGNKKRFKCYQCGVFGHFRKDCPKNKKNASQGEVKPHKAQAVVEDDVENDIDLFRAAVGKGYVSNEWLIDSGASCHMTRQKGHISDYSHFDKPEKVNLGDGYALDAVGKGNVRLKMLLADGMSTEAVLTQVLFVPDLRCNLFSVRTAVSKGKDVTFSGKECRIRDQDGNLKAQGILDGKLYKLQCESMMEYASVSEDMELWHNRLGHMSEQRLKHMINNEMVNGVTLKKSGSLKLCEGCVGGKTAKKKFEPVGERRTTQKLELVHSDVCGPMKTISHGGKKYFVTFTDDYTRCATVYFIAHKSEVLEKFKEYEAMVTTKTGLQIKALRSDNGGEYLSENFKQFLKMKGIQHELTIPHTPQQNGISERLNRTLVESARAMLIHSGLPKSFWAEAISTASYIRNRTQTSSLKDTTPYEMWYGRKPDLGNMKVFGCEAHILLDDSQRGKLDPKTKKMMFVGYSLSHKGYRLYDPDRKKVYVRRDVFNEEAFGNKPSQVLREETTSDDNNAEERVFTEEEDGMSQMNVENEIPQQERPQRERRRPVCYGYDEFANSLHYVLNVNTLEEALESEDADKWKNAADEEYNSLKENNTWNLVKPPPNAKIINSRWVFKVKHDSEGNVERHKARLVAKGYSQVHGVDYNETFSPVVRFTTVRALLAFGVQQKRVIHQMDVTTAFLNGKLEEDVYMHQPEGYKEPGKEDLVCKLNKSLYGLKQAPRCWNTEFHEFLSNMGFRQSNADPCVYLDERIIIAIYVDDLVILTHTDVEMISIKRSLEEKFKMKDLGAINFFLGVSVEKLDDGILLHQKSYIEEILAKYCMQGAKPVSTPRDMNVNLVKDDGSKAVDRSLYQSMVGALLYLSMATRPDISQAVGVVSRFSADPRETHLTAVKRIFCYLKGTIAMGLEYRCVEGCSLTCYSDADWAGDLDTRHSTSGYVFMFNGSVISWNSRLQRVTALSTAEAEYIALAESCKEVMWLKKLFNELNVKSPVRVMEDNQAAIAMVKNPVYHARSKHIDIRFHYIRDLCKEGHILIQYCPSSDNLADIMTKPVPRLQFERLRGKCDIVSQ